MTLTQTRFALIAVFLTFLVVQVVAVALISGRMWPEDLEALMVKLLAIYSVHLGVILGGIFALSRRRVGRPSSPAAWTAIGLAVTWNLLIAWRTVQFSLADEDSVADLIRYFDTVASASSFLVTGALTFFFAKSSESRSA